MPLSIQSGHLHNFTLCEAKLDICCLLCTVDPSVKTTFPHLASVQQTRVVARFDAILLLDQGLGVADRIANQLPSGNFISSL